MPVPIKKDLYCKEQQLMNLLGTPGPPDLQRSVVKRKEATLVTSVNTRTLASTKQNGESMKNFHN
jgi:hypothetical protein